MSSQLVRDEITAFITSQFPTEQLIDLTADFEEVNDLLIANGFARGTPWLGLQFVGAEEQPVDVRANNQQGVFRETGVIFLHVVERASIGVAAKILPRGEAIRNKFRAQTIGGGTLINTVSPVRFGDGATISFSGGYQAGLIELTYQRDILVVPTP